MGPLYLLAADIQGALRAYEWYGKEFPDDVPEAFNHLYWVLTLLRSENKALAKSKLREHIFENLYMIPFFLGQRPQQHPFRNSSNWSASEHAWIKEKWEDSALSNDISKYIELHKKLDLTKN